MKILYMYAFVNTQLSTLRQNRKLCHLELEMSLGSVYKSVAPVFNIYSISLFNKLSFFHFQFEQWQRQNFSATGSQLGHQN